MSEPVYGCDHCGSSRHAETFIEHVMNRELVPRMRDVASVRLVRVAV